MGEEDGARDYRWRVTCGFDGPLDVAFGIEIPDDEQDLYLQALGEVLIKLGTQLMGSRLADDDRDDDWGDGDR